MRRYILTTFSFPIKGLEIEYNKWYEEIHLNDLLKIPGIKSGQRYVLQAKLIDAQTSYLTIYEIETDDIEKVMQYLKDDTYDIRPSSAIDSSSIRMQVYENLGHKFSS